MTVAIRYVPGANDVRVPIRNFGGSVQVVLVADILKVHVHTDTPEAVFTFATRWGRIESTKAGDMRAQHRKPAHGDRRPVAVVADSAWAVYWQVEDGAPSRGAAA